MNHNDERDFLEELANEADVRREQLSELAAELQDPRQLDVATGTVQELLDVLLPWFDFARFAELPDAPDAETAEEIVRGLFTDRGTGRRGQKLRPRASAPKGCSDIVRAAWGLRRWHVSGGDLTGLFLAKLAAGDRWPEVETAVEILRVAFGSPSPALAAWKRTGLF